MPNFALITGASAGLGAEFARQLSGQGYHLILVARRLPQLTELARELQVHREDLQVHCIAADLATIDAPAHIIAKVNALGCQVDFLINNAGAGGPDLMAEPDWQPQREFLQLMMLSIAQLCHHFVPQMVQRGYGRVINVASVAGRIIRGGDCHYGPSKAYVVALSEALGLSVRKQGVHVSALCPGFTHTNFHLEGELADMKASTPKFIWYGAEVVVADALKAVERGKLICMSGRLYRMIDPLLQWKFTRRLIQRFA